MKIELHIPELILFPKKEKSVTEIYEELMSNVDIDFKQALEDFQKQSEELEKWTKRINEGFGNPWISPNIHPYGVDPYNDGFKWTDYSKYINGTDYIQYDDYKTYNYTQKDDKFGAVLESMAKQYEEIQTCNL